MHGGDQETASSDDGNAIVIYQSTNREGSTFSLSPSTRRAIEARFGDSAHFSPRIFIAHRAQGDLERLHGHLARHILMLLTGLPEDRLAALGVVQFRDAVTEQVL
jgi:hypothetical protein